MTGALFRSARVRLFPRAGGDGRGIGALEGTNYLPSAPLLIYESDI
jgi:hypothetical protein